MRQIALFRWAGKESSTLADEVRPGVDIAARPILRGNTADVAVLQCWSLGIRFSSVVLYVRRTLAGCTSRPSPLNLNRYRTDIPSEVAR